MFCPNCGSKLSDNARFCKSCGTPTENETAQAVPNNIYNTPQPDYMNAPERELITAKGSIAIKKIAWDDCKITLTTKKLQVYTRSNATIGGLAGAFGAIGMVAGLSIPFKLESEIPIEDISHTSHGQHGICSDTLVINKKDSTVLEFWFDKNVRTLLHNYINQLVNKQLY